MKMTFTKSLGQTMLMLSVAFFGVKALADSVTSEDVRYAARGWSIQNASAFGELGNVVDVTAEYDPVDGSILWYVVRLEHGAAIVSPDTEIEPIIAVLPDSDGDIPPRSPLRAMLLRDLRQRKIMMGASGAAMKSAVNAITSKTSSKWSNLVECGKGMKRLGSNGNPATIVKWLDGWNRKNTEASGQTLRFWNQDYSPKYFTNTKVFNYCTPDNDPCGCVATAGSAVLHYFRISSGNVVQRECRVDGRSVYYTTTGGPYDWSLIDAVNLTYGSPVTLSAEVCRDLLGRVASDVGIGCGMSYTASQSGSASYKLGVSFRTVFNFQNAQLVTVDAENSGPNDGTCISTNYYPEIIYNQIRAGAPVVLGIDSHEVVASGFGIDSDGQNYTYVFLGWGGSNDAWYALPEVNTKSTVEGGWYVSKFIDEIITEIAPSDNNYIPIVGRVTDAKGVGLSGESILLSNGKRVTTDANGYWGTRVAPTAGYVIAESRNIRHDYTVGSAAQETSTSAKMAAILARDIPKEINIVFKAQESVVSTKPSQLSATPNSDGSKVILTWNYPEAGASFYIYRSTTGTKPHGYTYTKTSTASGLITFDDSSVTSGTTYYYWVSAKQSGENYTESESAGPVSATPKKTLASISIIGKDSSGNVLTSVDSRGRVYYTCTATYSDKSTAVVNPAWNVDPSVCGNFFSGNTFTANPLATKQTATVLAAYSDGGEANVKKATCKLTVLASAVASRPANDNFDNAIQLNGTSGKTSGTTAGATVESDEFLAYNTSANTVWWTWTAPADGNLTLTTDGSGIATAIDVYSGDSLGSVALFNRLGYDYSILSSSGASVKCAVTKGARYNIRVAGYNNAEGAVSLSWSLSALEKITAPKNFSATYDSANNCVNLSWEKGASYCHYVLYRAAELTQPGKPQRKYAKPGYNTYSYVDSNVIAGAKYWYWVVATKDGYADSDPVGPVSVTMSGTSRPDLCFTSVPSGWPQAVFLSNADSNTKCVRRFGVGETIYLFNEFHNGGSADTPNGVDILHEVLDESGNVVASDLYTFDGVLKAGKDLWWPGSVHPVLQGLTPGNYTYRCTLDDDHAICEASESNNAMTYDFVVAPMSAQQFYVDASGGSDANDGFSASSAFASIQKAIDNASDGDTIWVDDGTYASFVTEDKRIIIQSVNGAADTIIDASLPSSGAANGRCAILGRSAGATNTVLSGFSLINGVGYNGGGVYGGTLTDCALMGNQSPGDDNDNGAGSGGAACCSVLHRCLVVWNSARKGGAVRQCVMNNCLVGENEASQFGGAAYDSTMNNCTVVGNHSDDYAGGCYLGEVNNCIVWDNLAESGSNAVCGTVCRYSCVDDRDVGGIGVIHDNPIFMRWAGIADGDYSLQPNSPCVNAGCDAYVVGDKDLNDDVRVFGLHVDMGAFEWQGDYPDINLVFAKDEDKGWTSPVFLTTTRGGCEGMTEFAEGDVIYLYYGILNAASPVDVCNFKVRFTLNSTVTFDDDWTGYGVNGGTVGSFDEWRPGQLQSLAPGSYTLKCKIIAAEGVVETNTSDNEFTINFVVKSEQQEVYGITYANLCGATHNNPSTYEVGSTIAFTPPTERAGYTFTGWMPESIAPSTTGEQTVTAGWRANTYTIGFDSNGGIGSMEPQTFTYDVVQSLRPNAFTREGYDFLGWAWMPTNEVPQFADGEAIKNLVEFDGCELTFFAVWSEITSSDPVPANYVTVSSSTYYGEGLAFPFDNIDYALTYANPSDAGPISTLVISNVLDEAFDCTCAAVGSIVIADERFDDLSGVMEGRDTFTLSSGVKVDISIIPDVATRTVVWTFAASSSSGKGVLLYPGQTLVANYSACPCNVSGDDFIGYEIGTEVYFIADGGVPVYSETPCVNVIACQPDAPTGLAVSFNKNTAGDNYHVTLTWDSEWPEDTKYIIYRSDSIIIDWDNPYDEVTGVSYTDPDASLIGGSAKYYAVCACPSGPYIQGCGATIKAVVPVLLEPNETACDIAAEGVAVPEVIAVRANCEWSIEANSADTWLHIQKADASTLTYTADANDGEARSSVVQLVAGTVVVPLTFSQDAVQAVKYTVTFAPNGGECEISSKTVGAGEPVGDLPVATYAGHSFVGWFTEDGMQVSANTIVNGDVTYFAHWVPVVEQPVWTPVVKGMNLTLYAQVYDKSADAYLDAEGSVLAAFDANGECRGKVAVMTGPNGIRVYQLTIGYESSGERGVTLKLWDAASGEIIDIPASEILYAPSQLIGKIAEPVVYQVGVLTQDITLNEGWNWVSTFLTVEENDVGTFFGDFEFADDDVVKGEASSATYFDCAWYPDDFMIEPCRAYVVKKSAGGTESHEVEGFATEGAISVDDGWNWFGSCSSAVKTVADLRHSEGFSDDDIIKGALESATYKNGNWYPSTMQLKPGVGYLAKLANGGEFTFEVGVSSANAARNALVMKGMPNEQVAPDWKPVVKPGTFTVYARAKDAEGNYIETDGSLLAAFDGNGECRGVCAIDDGPSVKFYQLNIGVESDGEPPLTLKVWNAADGSVSEIGEKVSGNINDLIGTISVPIEYQIASGDPTPAVRLADFGMTFNGKSLSVDVGKQPSSWAVVGSSPIAGNYVESANGFALDLGTCSAGPNISVSPMIASGRSFAISYFGTIGTVAKGVVWALRYSSDLQGLVFQQGSAGTLQLRWMKSKSSAETAIALITGITAEELVKPHHYLVQVSTGGQVSLYMDGVKVYSAVNSTRNFTAHTYDGLSLGRAYGGDDLTAYKYGDGVVDDFRVFTSSAESCLSDEEVAILSASFSRGAIYPELPSNPTSADVYEALDGSADTHLQVCITEPTVYNAYRAWAETVKAPGGSTAAGAQAVKDSPNAWLSFALDSATLIQNPPADGDVKVEKFEQTATAGLFDFTVGVESIPVGDDAKPGNLAKVFGIEGGSTLSPQDMSADKVDITFGTPENGKVKFTAGPKDKTQPSFFMRVMMK